MSQLADELRRFNTERKQQFGVAPLPDKPLPLPPTGVGGDVFPPNEDDHGARNVYHRPEDEKADQ